MSSAEYRLLLAARRERLVLLAQQQRLQLAQEAAPLLRSWASVERGLTLFRALRSHVWLLLPPLTLLLLWRPRSVLRAVAAAATVWRARRSAQRLLGLRRTR
jgi:hypothetical protein